MQFSSTFYAFYGSLLKGFWNHTWSLDEHEPVALTKVRGYALKDNGCFPAAFESPDDVVCVEVYDMALVDPEIVEAIDGMEFGCGYVRRLVRTEDGLDVWLYVMTDANARHYPYAVPNGDWRSFKQQEEKSNVVR